MPQEEVKFVIKADNKSGRLAVKQMTTAFKQMGGQADKTQKKTAKLFSEESVRSMKRGALLAATAVAAVGLASLKMAAEAVESENLFEVSMGNMAKAGREFSERLRNDLGLNAFEVRKQVGIFFQMTSAMGFSKEAAFDLSTGIVSLAFDMASFFNLPIDVAFQKLQSGIVGEIEPLRRLGILVDDVTITTAAYAAGLVKVGDKLTQTQKVQARYIAILNQTGNAQGDLARTLDSPLNQLRILGTRFEEISIKIGMGMLPSLSALLGMLGGTADSIDGMSGSLVTLSNIVAQPLKAFFLFGEKINLWVIKPLLIMERTILKANLTYQKFGKVIGLNTTKKVEDLGLEIMQLDDTIREVEQAAAGWTAKQADLIDSLNRFQNPAAQTIVKTEEIAGAYDDAAGGAASLTSAVEIQGSVFESTTNFMKAQSIPTIEGLIVAQTRLSAATDSFTLAEADALDIQKEFNENIAFTTVSIGDLINTNGALLSSQNAVANGVAETEAKYDALGEEMDRNSEKAADWGESVTKQVSTVFTDLSKGIADSIIEWTSMWDTFKNIAEEFATSILRLIFESLLNPLLGALKGLFSGGGFDLGKAFGGFGDIAKGIGGLFGGGAADVAGDVAGGAAGSAAGGAAGGAGGAAGAFGAKTLALLTNPITIAIGGAIAAGFVIWKKFIQKDAFESGAKEVGRDFGIAMGKGTVDSFVKTLEISKKQFDGIRKDILSSPKFLEEVLIPAAKASGSVETLIDKFRKLETVMGTIDLSGPLREAIESGDFTEFNKQWFDLFKQSKALVAVFGNEIPAALFGTEKAIGQVIKEMENLIAKTGLTEEFADAFMEGFAGIQGSMEGIPQVAANLAGQFEGLVSFLTGNGISALDAQGLAWDQFGGKITDTFNSMSAMGIAIPPFIQQLIDWAVENERVAITTDGMARAMEFAETTAGMFQQELANLVTEFEGLVDEMLRTGKVSDELAGIVTGLGLDMTAFQDAAKLGGLQEFQSDILSLKSEIDKLLPVQESWIDVFLRTGEITDVVAEKIVAMGGDLETFRRFKFARELNDEFISIKEQMDATGEVTQALIDSLVGLTSIELQTLIDELLEAGGATIDFANLSNEAQEILSKGISATEQRYIDAAQSLSDQLGNINDSLITAISNMTDALVDAIQDVSRAILGLPTRVDLEIVTTHRDVFLGSGRKTAASGGGDEEKTDEFFDNTDGRDRRAPGEEGEDPLLESTREGLNQLAHGGIVTRPTIALIGEAGPEAVIPLDKLSGMGGAGMIVDAINGIKGGPLSSIKKVITTIEELPIELANIMRFSPGDFEPQPPVVSPPTSGSGLISSIKPFHITALVPETSISTWIGRPGMRLADKGLSELNELNRPLLLISRQVMRPALLLPFNWLA